MKSDTVSSASEIYFPFQDVLSFADERHDTFPPAPKVQKIFAILFPIKILHEE